MLGKVAAVWPNGVRSERELSAGAPAVTAGANLDTAGDGGDAGLEPATSCSRDRPAVSGSFIRGRGPDGTALGTAGPSRDGHLRHLLYDTCCTSPLRSAGMPRHVDHAARRRHVAVTAAELVGTHGLDALTFRNVADAAGCSTTVVTHYFADKRDLLLSTFREVADRLGARFDEAQRGAAGSAAASRRCCRSTPARRTEWRLLTCFWGVAISDPEFAAEDAGHVRSAQARIKALLRREHPDVADAELDVVSRRLVTIVHGLGAQSALDPDHWSAAQQRRVLAHELGLPRSLASPVPGRGP